MFDFLKSSRNGRLEGIVSRIYMNMSNNYKDAAQLDLKEFEAVFCEMRDAGKLNEKQRLRYEQELESLKTRLKNYTHKDQKATWT